MSFREKSAWISVISMTAIYGYYFWSVVHAGPHLGSLHFAGLLATVIALIVVQVVLTIAVAIASPRDAQAPRDEREKLIELRATRMAYSGLATGIAMACFFGALREIEKWPFFGHQLGDKQNVGKPHQGNGP